MGLPLSPILADIVMEKVLDLAIPQFDFVPVLFVKYVDDMFTSVPTNFAQHTINILNSVNHRIQFTSEVEKDGQIPFLDVIVFRNNDGTIGTRWYSKPSSSNRLLNFFSNHPFQHKTGVIDNAINRIFGLSETTSRQQNTIVVKNILEANHYPAHLINKGIRKFFHKKNNRDTTLSTVLKEPITYKGISYISSCSVNIGRALCEELDDVKVGYKPFKTNRSNFSQLKDKTNPLDKCNIVYKIPCWGDGFSKNKCELCYIGHTGNKFGDRLGQHQNDVKKSNDEVEAKNGQTALVRHFQDGHAPDFENASILMMEPNEFKRRILESLNILTNNSMNFRKDVDSISKVYHNVLDVKFSD
ncbi:uncharacterized protein LOC119078137 [Bradysia coprophila]|uniref:uncharacterized protein LOC119078137 n=1 Tax=Bradysia coprophila TaxID=38358 RepID=UPI00187DC668|nr:uncharacterized protein LOC119078137 [Bradysia coprophila]